jgi:hypothetical protein
MFTDFMRFERSNARKRFIRTAVIGLGFLSGLWNRLGFDPGTWVQGQLELLLLSAKTGQETLIALAFHYGPALFTLIAVMLVYRRAGLWGFVAVGLAYVAGLWLSVISIVLLAIAVLIAMLSVRR